MTYTLNTQERGPLNVLTASVGKKAKTLLQNDVRTIALRATLEAQVQIAVAAATAIRNRGSPWAMYETVGLTEAEKEKWAADPRALVHASQAAAPSGLSATRLASTAIGTYNLVESLHVPFAHPYAVDPEETAYNERNPLLELAFFVVPQAAATMLSRILTVGGATVTLNSMTLRVRQIVEQFRTKRPVYLPTVEAISVNVPAANPKLEIPLKYSDRIRAMVISQDSDPFGEVTDIINTLSLRGDKIRWFENVKFDDLARDQEAEFGGDVYASAAGRHVYINFQQNGRLARVLAPAQQDTNLRLELGVQPSVTGGATASRVNVTLLLLTRDPFVGPDGRRVVDPAPSFELV